MYFVHRLVPVLALVLLTGLISACAMAPVDEDVAVPDPYEDLNRSFYAFNNALDRAIIAPAADVYVTVTPAPVRTGVGNFFDNLGYPTVFINAFLQGKFEQAFEDLGRFLFNSTFGLGGLIDFSSGVGLERHDEDFGQTLAVWGFDPGIYHDLPMIGPKTSSEAVAIPADMVTDVLFYASSSIAFPLGLLRLVNKRANLDSAIKLRDETALDPYVFQREAYLQHRAYLIHDGDPPRDDLLAMQPSE